MHGNLPAHVVLYKTSSYDAAEIVGFQCAADSKEIDYLDLIWIQRRAAQRLFRSGDLPPLRGTVLELDASAIVVYTRGSVPFFRAWRHA